VIEKTQNTGEDIEEKLKTKVLQDLARISSIQYGKDLSIEEMNHITDKLFACQSPNYTVDGRSIVQIISINDIIQRFNN
jgi:DNA mismatch repair protein MutL